MAALRFRKKRNVQFSETNMKYLFYPFFICLIISSTESANILGIFPLPGRSHYIMFERLFKALAAKGHHVDIVGHFPLEKPLPRYNDLSLKGSIPSFVNTFSISDYNHLSLSVMISVLMGDVGKDLCESMLNTSTLANLKKTNKKYDLVVTEIFGSDCMLGFGYYFKTPVISLISSVDFPWGGVRIGNPDNPAYIPTYFADYVNKMNLKERVMNTLVLLILKLSYKYLSNIGSNKVAKRFFGPDLPDLEELAANTSLILVNSHFSMNDARPTVPNFVEVGGLHIIEPKPLNHHFENILQTDSNGIIYFSMGSLVRSDSFSPDKLQGIFDAFVELPYKILWKANKENLPNGLKIPRNVHFEKWCPQMDILCHPNVKLFISHGGLMGSQEAVYCGVPRLGIPVFADQENNILQSVKMGTAIRLNYDDITKETMLEALRKLLEDPKYKQNAEKLSQIFRDRPLSAIDTAIYWVEYVIRYQGAPHLHSPRADLTWYQYYLLDVAIILLSAIGALLYFITKLSLLVFRLIRQLVVVKPKKE